jgi:hypothetical protein
MSPSTEGGLAEKLAVVQKLAVLLPRVLILLKRIHQIQLTSRETGDSRNQMDEKDSQISHHTIPTRARNPRNARTLGIRQRQGNFKKSRIGPAPTSVASVRPEMASVSPSCTEHIKPTFTLASWKDMEDRWSNPPANTRRSERPADGMDTRQ